VKYLLKLLIQAYKIALSPHLGAACRFEPSCSDYGLAALEQHGAWRGSRLILRRLLRCRPWGPCGYDPVPLVWEDVGKNR